MRPVFKRLTHCLVALLAAMIVAGCSTDTWDWDWLRGGDKKKQKPVTKARRPAGQPKTAQAAPKGAETPDDQRASDVDDAVQRYVREMRPDDDAYVPNDFNSKIQRQQDPKRKHRIRTVAERTRERPISEDEPPPNATARTTGDDTMQRDAPAGEPIVRTAAAEPQALTGDTASPQPTNEETIVPDAGASPRSETGAAATEPQSVPPGSDTPDEMAEARVTPNAAATTVANASDTSAESSPIRETPARPPVLEQIKVSAGPEPSMEAKGETDAGGAVTNTAKSPVEPVDTFKQRLEELESRVKKDPNNLDDQYNLRMMYLVNGQQDKALAPVDGMDSEIQEMIQAHFRALIAAQSSPGRDPAVNANHQLEQIEELRNVIRARADLNVTQPVLCTAIQGFGRYTPVETTEYQAGRKNQILAYIEVDNFRSEKSPAGMYRTLLSVRQSLLAKSGEELWSTHDANIEDLARERRQDFFLSLGPYAIPRTLSPGEYVLKVEVEDVLGGRINSNIVKFKMVP